MAAIFRPSRWRAAPWPMKRGCNTPMRCNWPSSSARRPNSSRWPGCCAWKPRAGQAQRIMCWSRSGSACNTSIRRWTRHDCDRLCLSRPATLAQDQRNRQRHFVADPVLPEMRTPVIARRRRDNEVDRYRMRRFAFHKSCAQSALERRHSRYDVRILHGADQFSPASF